MRRTAVAWVIIIAAALGSAACERIKTALDVPPPPPAPPPTAAVEPPPPPPLPPPPPDPVKAAGLSRIKVTVNGPLEEAIRGQVEPELAPALTQVAARLIIWWLDVAHGLRAGDTLEVLFERVPGKEPLVHALMLDSGKNMKKYAAYLHQSGRSKYARYYDADGVEVEERIEGGPVDDYEQVTSILRDGRRHKGVDFKTPVGTPVKMPFDATLTRKNWNWRANGNSLEFNDALGRRIVFLHLSELPKTLQPGQRFKAGQLIAESGNTGHSTAPHLHYQLESPGGAILDPFKVHRVYHLKLEGSDLDGFKATRAKYDALFAFDPSKPPPPAAAAVAPAAPAAVPGNAGAPAAPAAAVAPAAPPPAATPAAAPAAAAAPPSPAAGGSGAASAVTAAAPVAPAAAEPGGEPPAAPVAPVRLTDPGARR